MISNRRGRSHERSRAQRRAQSGASSKTTLLFLTAPNTASAILPYTRDYLRGGDSHRRQQTLATPVVTTSYFYRSIEYKYRNDEVENGKKAQGQGESTFSKLAHGCCWSWIIRRDPCVSASHPFVSSRIERPSVVSFLFVVRDGSDFSTPLSLRDGVLYSERGIPKTKESVPTSPRSKPSRRGSRVSCSRKVCF